MVRKSANDNLEWDETEHNQEDLLYLQLKADGLTKGEIDQSFTRLDENARRIVDILQRDGVSDQQIDDAIAEIRCMVEHPDYPKYQTARLKQRCEAIHE